MPSFLQMHYHKLNRVTLVCWSVILLAPCLYSQNFVVTKSGEGLEIHQLGKKVLFYQQQPKSLGGKYERAGYVHPLYSLNGNVLTEDFPEDHPFHRGIFWAWHQIVVNNKQVADGWISENISWKPVNVKIKKKKDKVVIQSTMTWNVHGPQNDSTDIVHENTRITVHQLTGRYRAIDFDIHLSALADSLKIGGSDDAKGYGGFCLRLKLPNDISFVSNDTAVTPIETAVNAGPWMDFTGSFDGASMPRTGVTVFCGQPTGDPQSWILRRKSSMQNIPYPGKTPVELSKEGLKLSYRIIIHDGNLNHNDLEKLYKEYIRKR